MADPRRDCRGAAWGAIVVVRSSAMAVPDVELTARSAGHGLPRTAGRARTDMAS